MLEIDTWPACLVELFVQSNATCSAIRKGVPPRLGQRLLNFLATWIAAPGAKRGAATG